MRIYIYICIYIYIYIYVYTHIYTHTYIIYIYICIHIYIYIHTLTHTHTHLLLHLRGPVRARRLPPTLQRRPSPEALRATPGGVAQKQASPLSAQDAPQEKTPLLPGSKNTDSDERIGFPQTRDTII